MAFAMSLLVDCKSQSDYFTFATTALKASG